MRLSDETNSAMPASSARSRRCIDRRDFAGWSILAIRWGKKKREKKRKREREGKRLKVRRVKKKRERECPPSVKYCPENRTVFINPARKSVFMESLPGGEEARRLFGTLYVFRDVPKRLGSIRGSGAFFNEDAFDFPCANDASFFLSRNIQIWCLNSKNVIVISRSPIADALDSRAK